jgi:hemoglobin
MKAIISRLSLPAWLLAGVVSSFQVTLPGRDAASSVRSLGARTLQERLPALFEGAFKEDFTTEDPALETLHEEAVEIVVEMDEEEGKQVIPPMTTLMDKLGGRAAVCAAVEEMYDRLMADPLTGPFFEETDMASLKVHQVEFMKIAFTEIPEGLDVTGMLNDKHFDLFEKGLDETHFDAVATHFVGALVHLDVPQELIDQAVGVVGPLRPIFEEGARAHKEKSKA